MRIPRFYCPDISSDVLEIHDQKIIHHLIKVLRARQGQSIVLFDGNGKTFECEIKEIEKNKIKLDLLDSHTSKKKNIITFNFFLPILKRESLISVATKLAELGVDKISLYLPDKVDQSMAKKDFNKLTEKITETLILACSQSGNNFIPKLKFFNNLKEALDVKDGRIVMLDTLPEATSLISEVASGRVSSITILPSLTSRASLRLLKNLSLGIKLLPDCEQARIRVSVIFSVNLLKSFFAID